MSDLGHVLSPGERAALEHALPTLNAMSDEEFAAHAARVRAQINAATPRWRRRWWEHILDWLARTDG